MFPLRFLGCPSRVLVRSWHSACFGLSRAWLLLPIVQPIEPQPNQQRSFFLLQTFNGNRDFGCQMILVHSCNEGEKAQRTGKFRKKLIQLNSWIWNTFLIAIVQIEDKQKSINCSIAVHPQLSNNYNGFCLCSSTCRMSLNNTSLSSGQERLICSIIIKTRR
jgi:hypothetical protein